MSPGAVQVILNQIGAKDYGPVSFMRIESKRRYEARFNPNTSLEGMFRQAWAELGRKAEAHEICKKAGLPKGSFHSFILRKPNIFKKERRGKKAYYWIEEKPS